MHGATSWDLLVCLPEDYDDPPQRSSKINDYIIDDFQALACNLGFSSSRLVPSRTTPEPLMIKKLLQEVRPSESFELSDLTGTQILALVQKIPRKNILTEHAKTGDESKKSRCG